jgi:hypothetical protein
MTKIWVEFEEWDCGDGCCSDSWYEICTSDGMGDRELRDKYFNSKSEVVEYLTLEYPEHEVDIDKCQLAWYING